MMTPTEWVWVVCFAGSIGFCVGFWLRRWVTVVAQDYTDAYRTMMIEMRDQRDNLVTALEDNFRKSNPGEPMPDWLAVTQSMADYRAGKWKTADEVIEELSEVE